MEMRRKKLKLTIYTVIILFWISSFVYLFASRSNSVPLSAPENFKSEITPISEWMGLYMGNKKIGYDYESMSPSGNGFEFRTRMFMRILLMGQEKEITTISDYKTDKNYSIEHIDFSLKTSGLEIAANGYIKNNVLTLSLMGPGGTTKQEIRLKSPPITSAGIILRIVKDGFSRTEYNFETFDPTIQQALPVKVKILGRETRYILGSPVDTFKLHVQIKDMTETMWVTPQGETVEEISPLGFRAVLEPKAMALTKGWGKEPVDLISSTAIRAEGLPVTYPAGVYRMDAYVTGISDTESMPSLSFQERQGNIITVVVPEHIGTYRLPYKHTVNIKGVDVSEELGSNTLINADNPEIINRAKEIIHGETDAKKAVELLNNWVYTHVKDAFTVALPRSVDLLQNPQGDCKAHTILFTALARSIGIPTKMAMGVVLMPDGYFYYHAWPIVYLNEWVPVDPTLGEFPADATHIVLASGSLDHWMDILGVVGRLKIDIMKVN
ncbi:MAG: transglutaminase-like domain-containing protein [bacterium]